MDTNTISNLFERTNAWIRESITIKLLSIGFLVLILLIPSAWIESLIAERQGRADAVVSEISDKWSGEQTITGPVLVIPVVQREKIDKGKEGIEIREWKEKLFFLPDQLTVSGRVNPQLLHRGIFEAAVYESDLQLKAVFNFPDFKKLNLDGKDMVWSEATLVTGLSDMRGITKNPILEMDGRQLAGEPSKQIGLTHDEANNSGIVAPLNWQGEGDFKGNVTLQLSLKGSTSLYFIPTGKTTEVSLEGPWANPSFEGNFLPTDRTLSEKGFKANWQVLHYNRPFSQQWIGDSQQLSGAEFGVRLLIPVDQYQKTTRTAKYSVLIILLTFISLFMVEIMRKVRIHPFQYILIGAALIIYYTLLLSLSEQLGFNLAYGISTLATVMLITWYAHSFLPDRKVLTVFASLLGFFYLFIFVIIQLQDYSLLLGSAGLFIILGAIMYFSRNIHWYGENMAKQ